MLVCIYLVFVLWLFPALGGNSDVAPLDLMFSYSPDQAYNHIEAYGPQVRHDYVISAMSLDVAYPLTYSLMFAVWLTLLLKNGSPMTCAIRLLPFAVLIFDLMENFGIIVMLVRYPQRLDMLASATSMATSLKWVFASVVIILTLGLSLFSLSRYLFQWLVRK